MQLEEVLWTKGTERLDVQLWLLKELVEAKALLPGTSAQNADLIALMRALELLCTKSVNVYTNFRETFLILQSHGSIWKEKELLASK